MLVYISGKYSGSTEQEVQDNVDRAVTAAVELCRNRIPCYVPHLTYWIDKSAKQILGQYLPYDLWIDLDLHIIAEHITHMLVISVSNGVLKELQVALNKKIPIYTSLHDIIVSINATRKLSRLEEEPDGK
jgi:hypothetical protein